MRAPTFAVEQTLDTGQEEIWGLAWSPDGTLLACAGKDGTVQIWQGGTLQKKLFQGGWILDLGWNPDGTSLMAVDYTGLAKEWDVQGYLRSSIQLDGDGLGVDWSPKGRLFAVTTGQGGSRVLLFDAQSGVLRWRRQDVLPNYAAPFGYGLDEVNGVRYSPSGKWMATAHQDGRVMVHAAETGDPVFAAQLHLSGVGGARRVAWSSKRRLDRLVWRGWPSRLRALSAGKKPGLVTGQPTKQFGRWVGLQIISGSRRSERKDALGSGQLISCIRCPGAKTPGTARPGHTLSVLNPLRPRKVALAKNFGLFTGSTKNQRTVPPTKAGAPLERQSRPSGRVRG